MREKLTGARPLQVVAAMLFAAALAATALPAIAVADDACDHDWEVTYTQPGTCTEAGWFKVVCSKCGVAEARDGGLGAHKYKKVSVKAKKCKAGYKGKKCKVCGKVVKTKVLKAKKAHKWAKVAAKAATCTEDGCTAYKKCKVCAKVKDKEVRDALGHSWQVLAAAKAATCTEAGVTAHKRCKACGVEKGGDTVAALGHKWGQRNYKVWYYDTSDNPITGGKLIFTYALYCTNPDCWKNSKDIVGITESYHPTW